MIDEDFPDLSDLLGCYFNQDFMDLHGSPGGALRAFLAESPLEWLESAVGEIGRLLQDERFLSAPDSTLLHLNCAYNSKHDGLTALDWMNLVKFSLESEIVAIRSSRNRPRS